MVTTIITAMAAYSNERVAAIIISVLYRMLTEGIEDVLNTTIYLNLEVLVQYEGIVQLGIEIEEVWGVYQFVHFNIGIREAGWSLISWCKVWHMHSSGIDTRQREVKVL